uniref:YbaB/EbfC family DNA-binding protein n=1 Tax=Mycobacterium sp. (strain JLS) TaxID=164757 RepID=A0A5Q5CAU4_MYCSJ
MTDGREFDDDELAALASFTPRFDEDADDDLDALGVYTSTGPDDNDDPAQDLIFVAANPSGTVTVTALLGGECQCVDLAPTVTALTETELAAEIVAVAQVAAQRAGAGAYELFAAMFRAQGEDRASVDDLLRHQLRLPTPDEARASAAELAARSR